MKTCLKFFIWQYGQNVSRKQANSYVDYSNVSDTVRITDLEKPNLVILGYGGLVLG